MALAWPWCMISMYQVASLAMAANLHALTRQLASRNDDPTATPSVLEVQDALLTAKVEGVREVGFPIHPLRLIYELRSLLGDALVPVAGQAPRRVDRRAPGLPLVRAEHHQAAVAVRVLAH
jgi:hypothetical protein